MKKRIASLAARARSSGLATFLVVGALYYSWLDLGAFGTALFDAGALDDCLRQLAALSAYAASTAPLFAACLRPQNMEPLLGKSLALVAIGVGGCASTALLGAAGAASSVPLAIAGGMLQGLTLGTFSLVLVVAACRAGGAVPMGMLIAGSAIGGMAIDGILCALQPAFFIAGMAVLPVACAACCDLTLRPKGAAKNAAAAKPATGAKEKPAPPSLLADVRPNAALFAFVGAFAFTQGVLQYIAALSPGISAAGSALLGARFLAMSIVFALLAARHVRIDLVLRAGIVVSILGCILVSNSFFAPVAEGVGVAVMSAGYACFDVVAWALLAEAAYYMPKRSVRTVAFGVFVWQAGAFAGTLSGCAGDAYGSHAAIGVLASAAALGIVGFGVYFLGSEFWRAVRYGSSFSTSDEGAAGASGNEGERPIEAIAARRMLTKRETDILAYLAAGRSVPYIAEAECISENTVRSHTKSIYAKFGVHTKQELIDAIEAETGHARA